MKIVDGLEALCDALELPPKRVKALARAGAPIVVTGAGKGLRYLADLDALQLWFQRPQTRAGGTA